MDEDKIRQATNIAHIISVLATVQINLHHSELYVPLTLRSALEDLCAILGEIAMEERTSGS